MKVEGKDKSRKGKTRVAYQRRGSISEENTQNQLVEKIESQVLNQF